MSIPRAIEQNFLSKYIGFEDLSNHLNATPVVKWFSYPIYNIQASDNKYVISVILEHNISPALLKKLKVSLEEDTLTIRGETTQVSFDAKDPDTGEPSPFEISFVLHKHVKVKGSHIIDGILEIWLQKEVPAKKTVKQIKISPVPSSKPFLEGSAKKIAESDYQLHLPDFSLISRGNPDNHENIKSK